MCPHTSLVHGDSTPTGSCCISVLEFLLHSSPEFPFQTGICLIHQRINTLYSEVALSQWSISPGINTSVLPHLGWNESEHVPPWYFPAQLTMTIVLTIHTSLAASLPHLTALVALQVLPGIRFQIQFCTQTIFKDLFIEEPS